MINFWFILALIDLKRQSWDNWANKKANGSSLDNITFHLNNF